MLSFKLYILFSSIFLGCSIVNSYSIHEQFYPTIIHLASSKSNKVIILNFLFMVSVFFTMNLVKFIFGEIKEMERINIVDKMKRKMLDLALLFIYFGEDTLDTAFFVFLIVLMGLNILHWMTQKRSEYMIAESNVKVRDHYKLLFFIVLLIGLDFVIYSHITGLVRGLDKPEG